jgi:hypothetical protein
MFVPYLFFLLHTYTSYALYICSFLSKKKGIHLNTLELKWASPWQRGGLGWLAARVPSLVPTGASREGDERNVIRGLTPVACCRMVALKLQV